MNTSVTAVAFAVPLLPDKTDVDRHFMTSCWRGERRPEYEESRRRLAITRESVWIQPLPGGEVAVVVLEAEDIAAALAGIAQSQEPFDTRFRDHCRAVHGIDLEAGLPLPEQVLDFRQVSESVSARG